MGGAGVVDKDEFRWVRPPVQARSQASLTRILDAAEQVIGERGFDAATVADIVRQAKSSVGVFYDRFRDKETLLACLHERFCQESHATADDALSTERWGQASIEQIVAKLVGFLVEIYRKNLGLMRAFLVRSGTDRAFAERGMQLHLYIASKLAAVLLTHRGEIPHARPEFAIEFGLRMIGSTLDSLVLFDDAPASGVGLHDEETSRELAQAFLAYLGITPKRTPQGRKKRVSKESSC
jgi:AcrR family transcriptional regulator